MQITLFLLRTFSPIHHGWSWDCGFQLIENVQYLTPKKGIFDFIYLATFFFFFVWWGVVEFETK